MKKLLSIFMAGLMFCFSVCAPGFAGGVNKEETLEDGTKLIYISTEKIPEAIARYAKKRQELLDARWTTKKIIAVKVAAAAAGIAGYRIPSKIKDLDPQVLNGIQAVSIIAALFAFFYPNYVEKKLGREYCFFDTRPDYGMPFRSIYWGNSIDDEHEYGIGEICFDLYGWYHKEPFIQFGYIEDEHRDSGVVIVLRPRSKWRLSNTTHSGIYSQKEVGSDERGLLRLLKIEISKGK